MGNSLSFYGNYAVNNPDDSYIYIYLSQNNLDDLQINGVSSLILFGNTPNPSVQLDFDSMNKCYTVDSSIKNSNYNIYFKFPINDSKTIYQEYIKYASFSLTQFGMIKDTKLTGLNLSLDNNFNTIISCNYDIYDSSPSKMIYLNSLIPLSKISYLSVKL